MRTLSLCFAFLAFAHSISAAERPPNIVVILADDLGYGDLSCFGQKVLQTPRLDQMAKEGMRFTQFYAGATVCAPSRCTFLTGKHNGHSLIRGNSDLPIVLTPETPNVGSMLKKAGYTTACIGKWGLGTPDNLTNPNDVGFDHFYGYLKNKHAHNPYPEFLIHNGKVVPLKNEVAAEWKKWQDPKLPSGGQGVAEKRVDYAPDLIVDDALKFIKDHEAKPFFLFLSLITPHANNEGKQQGMEVPDLGEFADKDWPAPEKAFAAMIRNLDRDTGRILDQLKASKLDKDTLVIFTSDNGPHQEGGHKADFFASNGTFRGIKRDLNEGGIRVPMIAWWPGKVEAGSRNDLQYYLGDMMATAAELSGAELPKGLDSDSLVPALQGKAGEDKWKRKSPLYWEFYEGEGAQAVRFGKWKAIRKPMFTGEVELYDMSNDTAEKRDYSKRRPDLTNHAKNLLEKNHVPDPNWKLKAATPK
jgi:arylsulfatase A-like enzyme